MKWITALFLTAFPFLGAGCAAGAMGGGCGMGGHAGHGGSHESHIQEAEPPTATRPAPDPNFDADRTRAMLEAYDRMVVVLTEDRIAGVEEAAAVIVKQAPNDAIREAAAPISRAEEKRDIARVREQFKPLSAVVVQYVEGNHAILEAALEKANLLMPQKAYCPMVETAWLQHGAKITNPFYGSSMLRCGEFQDWAEGD